MVGKDFDQGLAKIKEIVEKEPTDPAPTDTSPGVPAPSAAKK